LRLSDGLRRAARRLRSLRGPLALLLTLSLAGCGSSYSYWGNPGGDARRLVRPPAFRVAVAPPTQALLTDAGAQRFSETLAEALRGVEVPAVAVENPNPLDWPLRVSAERRGDRLVPRYELRDADGEAVGSADGAPVPLRGWGLEEAPVFKQVAERDVKLVVQLLERVEAARKASDPAALAGQGIIRIRLAGVRGAPGDGNRSLNEQLRAFLTKLAYLPQDNAEGATYAVQGQVEAVATPGNKQRIELQWIVTRRDGYELGRVVQINEVPRGTLNGLWGDVAYVAAEQAAGGIREVLRNAAQPPEVTNPAAPQAATLRP
jgi:hypothetical protein